MHTPRFLLSTLIAGGVLGLTVLIHSGSTATAVFAQAAKVANPITGEGLPNPTTKVTRRLTRHSTTLPPSSVTTLISLTHAPLMFLTDSAHFFRPAFTASSMLVLEAALSSMILATDMVVSLE